MEQINTQQTVNPINPSNPVISPTPPVGPGSENKKFNNIKSIGGVLLIVVMIGIAYVVFFQKTSDHNENSEIGKIEQTERPKFTPAQEIVSFSIVSQDVQNPFWATMYRVDKATGKMFFVVDRQKNIVREIVGADSQSFIPLSGADGAVISYGKDNNGVYCNDELRKDIDKDTFVVKNNRGVRDSTYATDKNNVYYFCERLNGADALSFERLAGSYGKDKNAVFLNGNIVKNADPKTFYVLTGGYAVDSTSLYKDGTRIGPRSYVINSNSTGEISPISYEYVEKSDSNRPQDPYTVFYGEKESGVIDSLKVLSGEGSRSLRARGQKIYFINVEGALSAFNPATNSVMSYKLGNLELLDKNGNSKINDYYFNGDDIYILYGPYCKDYLNKCDLDLIKFDSKTNQIETLVSHVAGRQIIKIDRTNNIAKIGYGEGDAGCVWNRVYSINLVNKKTTEQLISRCEGEADYKQKVQAVEDLYREAPKYANPIMIKSGMVVEM